MSTTSADQSSPNPNLNATISDSAPPSSPFKLIQTSTPLSAISTTHSSNDSDSCNTHRTLVILVHATNAFGSWGAGFALALHKLFPTADEAYKSWCDATRPSPDQWPSRELVGRCLVTSARQEDQRGDNVDGKVVIACLFTSYGYGSRAVRSGKNGGHAAKDGREKVIEATRTALEELKRVVVAAEREEEVDEDDEGGGEKAEKTKVVVYSPKFNSGSFGVDWEVTAGMIQEIFGDWEGEWRILADR